jgi:hypothetical protein
MVRHHVLGLVGKFATVFHFRFVFLLRNSPTTKERYCWRLELCMGGGGVDSVMWGKIRNFGVGGGAGRPLLFTQPPGPLLIN